LLGNAGENVAEVGWYILGENQQQLGPYVFSEVKGNFTSQILTKQSLVFMLKSNL